ncbi:MAG: AarF/ABC1/UbiB kinase family protein [Chloroflexi bacterium]|nr:AarF/ABC1/UbiB kinase family protein [Chloroflexota bacterium]
MPNLHLGALTRLHENLNRWREILAILIEYGFQDVVERLGLGPVGRWLHAQGPGNRHAQLPREVRIRMALSDIGTSGIKLGQILSTRGDLVGTALAAELERLQSDAPADPVETIRHRIESDLGQPIEALFEGFEARPLASASIAQVHGATLPGGERVVVKVRHPGVTERVRVDLAIMEDLVGLAERLPEFAAYRPMMVFREFRRTLLRELDLSSEAAHMRRIAAIFRRDAGIRVPWIDGQRSTRRVLTMERLEGIRISDLAGLRAAGLDLGQVARRGAEMYMEMILGHGFYHADPHPGNLLVLPDGAIGLLDYGMVGRLDARTRDDIEDLMLAVIALDAERMTELVVKMADVPNDLDSSALAWELDEMVSNYANQPVERFDMSGALNELVDVIRAFHMVLPANIALLIKVLVMLEGSGRLLNPEFNLIQAMRPYRRKLLARRISPQRQLRKLQRVGRDLDHLLDMLPGGLIDAIDLMRGGQFYVHLDHRGLEPSVNRLVLGLVASSLFLGSALLLAFDVPPLLRSTSLPGALGGLLSAWLGLRVLRAIDRSGHLDGG